MDLDPINGNPGYEQELDSLNADYGSEAFVRSLLQVYAKDCPVAIQRLLAAVEGGRLEEARNAIHSLSNIMGICGPAASQPLIEAISETIKEGQLVSTARQARELEVMVKASLTSIHSWLGGLAGNSASGSIDSRGKA
jgi:ferritin-like metal-binding protein YciE